MTEEEKKHIWDMFDKIVCIHFLPYKNDRLKNIALELKRIGILNSGKFEWEFTVPNKFYDYVKVPKDKTKHGHGTITPVTRPYAIQYYTLLKKLLYMGYERVLIFEDDVVFRKDVGEIAKIVGETPPDWDIVNYDPFRRMGWLGAGKGYWGHYYDLKGNEVKKDWDGDTFLRYHSVVYQADAMAYTRRAVEQIISKMEEMFVPADWYSWMDTGDLKTYCTSGANNICVQNKNYHNKMTGDGYSSTFAQIYGKDFDLSKFNLEVQNVQP